MDVLNIEFHAPGTLAKLHSQPANLDLRLAEIDEKASRKASGPQVIKALGDLNLAQGLDGLDLYDAFATDRALLYLLQKFLQQ